MISVSRIVAFSGLIFLSSCKTTESAPKIAQQHEVAPYLTCKGDGVSVMVERDGDLGLVTIKRQSVADEKLKAEYIREDLSPPQASISFAFLAPADGGLTVECDGRGTDEGAALRVGKSETIFLKCDFSKVPCGAPW